jgi:phosphoglycolate phosphatase-like HAD superfamily hydrolase
VRIILFDIDGTLLLTGGAGLRALDRVFRDRFGVEDAYRGVEFHGRTDIGILRAMLRRHLQRDPEPGELPRLADLYVQALEAVLAEGTPAFRVLPGVREALAALQGRRDVLLGLATGNLEPAAWAKLRHAGLDGFFGVGGFGTDSEDREELTRRGAERARRAAGGDERTPVLVVGDTVHDVRCARAIGAACLAVATGNATEEALRAAGADWTVPGLDRPLARRVLGLENGPIDPSGPRC